MSAPILCDLTIGVLGIQVPKGSGTIKWTYVFDKKNINRCEEVDIPLIQFMAQLPSSDRRSKYVEHLASDVLKSRDVTSIITNRSVVPLMPPTDELDLQYLNVNFGISPLRKVQLHDNAKHCDNHTTPHVFATMKSFFDGMNDLKKIQCILDVPLAHISPLDQLRMEAGIKFWAIFRLKDGLHTLWMKLVDYPTHKAWTQQNCDGEVVKLEQGDILKASRRHINDLSLTLQLIRILPPGLVHVVYTPMPSFSTSGQFYNYDCMHLTELSRFIDAELAPTAANQDMEHALETLWQMVIAIHVSSPKNYIETAKMPILRLIILHLHAADAPTVAPCCQSQSLLTPLMMWLSASISQQTGSTGHKAAGYEEEEMQRIEAGELAESHPGSER
ncbi:hypothetical protein EV702DRAFT_1044492 [Suillus placidus]|uniref:Uncharacterized protein n=1 Tax=Suillus placidus TaxID=48579 RepID=A0A9P6ZZC7_9AGAM|nr:hypothetical protein EV702DRAFT_1044492 [Suillus placidus]